MQGDEQEDPDNPMKVLGLILNTEQDRSQVDVKVGFSSKN
jgi:hypothetical protein